MRNFCLGLLLAVVLAGCDRKVASPTGIKEWSEVEALAGAFVLKGDATAWRRHTDISAMPAEYRSQFEDFVESWEGFSDMRHVSTEVMSPAEYEARSGKEWLALSGGRPSTLPRTKWHLQPEKLIVFNFVGKDPKDKSEMRWFVGVVRKEGLWYFVTSDPT